jgi:hypothetical protein
MYKTSRAAELARVGENRRERAKPTVDLGGVSFHLKHSRPLPRFNLGLSLHDAYLAQIYLQRELGRFVEACALEPSSYAIYVSILFVAPK